MLFNKKKSAQFAFLSSIFVSFCSIFLHHHVVSLFSYRRSQGSCHENAVFFLKYFCIFNKVMHVFIFKSLHLHPPSEIAGLLPRATFHHGLPRERFAQQPLCASCFVLDTVLCVLPICVLCVTRNLVLPGRSVGRIAHTFNISLWGRSCRLGLHLIIHNCLLTFPTSRCQEG